MDGIHDMGGMDGFGTVEPEPNEPVFHAAWEGRVLALNRAMGFTGSGPSMGRAGIEELPPDVYLSVLLLQKWALRLESILVVARGLVGADEIAAGHALRPGKPLKRTLNAADVPDR